MRPMKIDASLSRSADSGFRDTVISFLRKPVVIRRGQWNASSPLPPDPIHSIAIPEELLANSVYKNKIDGYFAFRATAVIRLQVNANKFQQGRLIMSYIPQGQVTGMFPNLRLFSLRTITQLPNVQLDAACDTEAILKIPYVSPTTHYNLLDQTGPHGVVYLHNYSALQYGTGISYADYTIWGSFEDIELVTPTLPTSVYGTPPSTFSLFAKRAPSEGRDYSSYNMVTKEKIIVKDLTGGDPNIVEREKDTVFTSQAKKVKSANTRPKTDPTDKELENADAGPVESVFNGINTVSTALQGVPLLSSVAAPVSWVSSALARTAGHFGWSNPANEGIRNKLTIFPYVNNSNAIDQSFSMGLKVDNKIQVLPGFAGTDIDEMNLAYICGVSAWWTTMNWTTSTGSGDLIGAWPMNLDSFRTVTNITTGDSIWSVADYCPAAFITELFEFWRGSIRLTFKFPKTDFHSGRLVVAFTPGYSDPSLAPTIHDTDYLHREIIDIREGNEFTMTFPYTSTLSWMDRSESYGKVWMFVLNPLVAPDTVAQNIQIITEMSVAPDVQFQNPTSCPHRVWGSEETVAPFVSQSGEVKLEKPCDIVDETIGNSKMSSDFYAATKYCAGEEVSSILHLLKRAGRIDLATKYTTVKIMSFRPFTIGGSGDPEGTPDDSQRSVFCGDMYSILAPLYAYNRGSVRLNFVRRPGGLTDQRVFYYPSSVQDPIVQSESGSIFPMLYRNGSSVPFDTTKDGGGSVQCPHYNQLHSRLNRITYANDTVGVYYVEPIDIYSSRNRIAYECTDVAGASSPTPSVYRSVGDDFALGFFLGIPPMVLAIAPRS